MNITTITGLTIWESRTRAATTLEQSLTAALESGIKDFENADLSGIEISGIDFTGLNLSGAYFKNSKFTNCIFDKCHFELTFFSFGIFEDCSFQKATLKKCYLYDAAFENCSFQGAKLLEAANSPAYPNTITGAMFTKSDLSQTTIYAITFEHCDFSDVKMDNAALHSVHFDSCFVGGLKSESSHMNGFSLPRSTGEPEINVAYKKNFTGMTFKEEPFEIKEANKVKIYRFNIKSIAPFKGVAWNLAAKAVKAEDPAGIYGYVDGSLGLHWLAHMEILRPDRKLEDIVILTLEVDKDHILYQGFEVAFSQANIINVGTAEEFIHEVMPEYEPQLALFKKAQQSEEKMEAYEKVHREWDIGLEVGEARDKRSVREKNGTLNRLNETEFRAIKNLALSHAIESEIHGIDHWQRVERNGLLLAKESGANTRIVQAFAYLHDCMRLSDGEDYSHGQRAANMVRGYKESIFRDFSKEEFDDLIYALANHTRVEKTVKRDIDTCFDADRLDLTRVGIQPDPERMATSTGAYYAANMDKLNEDLLTKILQDDGKKEI